MSSSFFKMYKWIHLTHTIFYSVVSVKKFCDTVALSPNTIDGKVNDSKFLLQTNFQKKKDNLWGKCADYENTTNPPLVPLQLHKYVYFAQIQILPFFTMGNQRWRGGGNTCPPLFPQIIILVQQICSNHNWLISGYKYI